MEFKVSFLSVSLVCCFNP